VIAAAQILVGLALVVQTLRHGGGVVSTGFLAGIVLVGIGAGRAYLAGHGRDQGTADT